MPPDREDRIPRKIRELGPWFHNLHLPGGFQTAPEHFLGDFPGCKWREFSRHIPADLSGWTCLDIGCNARFHAFELAKRGASVVGIDSEPRRPLRCTAGSHAGFNEQKAAATATLPAAARFGAAGPPSRGERHRGKRDRGAGTRASTRTLQLAEDEEPSAIEKKAGITLGMRVAAL
jgi:hypothetical protein